MEIITQTKTQDQSLVRSIAAKYEEVRDQHEVICDEQEKGLYRRYELGKTVHNAVHRADATQDALLADVAQQTDRSQGYYIQHRLFAEACAEAFPSYDPPVAGYIADALDQDRAFTWSAARRWSSSGAEAESAAESEGVKSLVHEVEQGIEALETDLQALEEEMDEATVSEDLRREAEGVQTVAVQTLSDLKSRLQRLPDHERRTDPTYLEWIRRQPCCVAPGSTDVIAHHLDRGGTATKGSDRFAVPLDADLHNDLHNAESERAWWERHGVNPWKVAADLMDDYIEAITEES